MPINECCTSSVICCETDASITEVAALMRKHHVGDVIVVMHEEGRRVPLGIVTDRDIVLETIALQVDVSTFTAGDLMTSPVVTVKEDAGIVETLRQLRNYKLRRMPVVTEAGSLSGIVTTDDIVKLLAMELSMISDVIEDQARKEVHLRR
jgi:CBS domain-containing protein